MLTINVKKENVYDRLYKASIVLDGTTIGSYDIDLNQLASTGKISGPDFPKSAEKYFLSRKGFKTLTGQSKEKYLKERRAFERYWGSKLL